MTAAATTGPKSDPRPTSSTPAISCAPETQASFSNLRVQRRRFSKRSFAAEAEIFSAGEVFDRGGLERDLGTEAKQHLRRRRGPKQEWNVTIVRKRGFAPLRRDKAPSPHKYRELSVAVRLLSGERL